MHDLDRNIKSLTEVSVTMALYCLLINTENITKSNELSEHYQKHIPTGGTETSKVHKTEPRSSYFQTNILIQNSDPDD